MIWTKENFRKLSEEDLCLEVLIPLFRAMGYKDIRYFHGGSLEQGKDLVMWKPDELKGRVNYASVVKAAKITGSAATASVVAFQAQQALGSSFVDEVTQESQTVHEVFIITSHEITKEGHESLKNALAKANVEKLIQKIDGEKLWSLVKQRLPHETIFSTLLDATKALDDIEEGFGYSLQASPDGVKVISFPKLGEGVEPKPIRVEAKFPDTPEGKEQELAFRRHVNGGHAAEVKAEYLSLKGVPILLSKMLHNNPDGIVSLGPRRSDLKIAVSLNFKPVDTKAEQCLFPLIELGTNCRGVEQVTLGNDQQPIPFKFHLTIRLADGGGVLGETFSFDFTEAESNFFSMLRASECLTILSRGGSLIVRDYNTERRLFEGYIGPNLKLQQGRLFQDVLRKLVWIQRQLNLDIAPPTRDFFEMSDIEDVLEIEAILKTGRFRGRVTDIEVNFEPDSLKDLAAAYSDSLTGEMELETDYGQKLLGVDVALGSVEILCTRAKFEPDLRTLAACLDAEVDGEVNLSARLILEDGIFDAKFKDWPKPAAETMLPAEEV